MAAENDSGESVNRYFEVDFSYCDSGVLLHTPSSGNLIQAAVFLQQRVGEANVHMQ